MAKTLTWRDEWTLRIETLDDDHKVIVGLLSDITQRFAEEPEQPEGSEEGDGDGGGDGDLYAALDRLSAYTREHFRREEEFMRTIDYPGLADHRSEHALHMAELTTQVREFRERGLQRLSAQELELLKQWVVAHILGADRGFADHYFEICGEDQA
jgi:hemerythrin-like metal-binding protein